MLMLVIENVPSHAEFLKTAHPIGRYGEPAESGETAAWLLSDASSFVTGAAIEADGGETTISTNRSVGQRTMSTIRMKADIARHMRMTQQELHYNVRSPHGSMGKRSRSN